MSSPRSAISASLRPYGETRWTFGGTLPTEREASPERRTALRLHLRSSGGGYRFTGQKEESGIQLYDYKARYYSPYLNRWIQPDTIIPNPANPQSLNRYSYVDNRPLNLVDPSGHMSNEHIMELFGVDEWDSVLAEFREGGQLAGRWGFLEMLTKLQEPGKLINYPSEMARLYGGRSTRDSSYPLPGDELLMTVSAGKVNGQWTLLEHLDDGSTRPVSVFEAGKQGAVWVGGSRGEWSSPWNTDYGHGLLDGEPGHLYVTLAPDQFDKLGAGLDSVGIMGDASGHLVGKIVSQIADVVSIYRSAWGLAQTVQGGGSKMDIALAVADFGLDVAGFQWDYGPDIASLLLNFGTSTRIDWVR